MIVYAEILIELAPVHSASIDMHQASPGEMPVWTAPDDRKEIDVSGPDDPVGTYQDLSAKHALGVPHSASIGISRCHTASGQPPR